MPVRKRQAALASGAMGMQEAADLGPGHSALLAGSEPGKMLRDHAIQRDGPGGTAQVARDGLCSRDQSYVPIVHRAAIVRPLRYNGRYHLFKACQNAAIRRERFAEVRHKLTRIEGITPVHQRCRSILTDAALPKGQSSRPRHVRIASHTDLEIVARDRSTDYARAAQAVVPRAQQVADRWHLLMNARQMLKRWLVGAHARQRALPVPSGTAAPVPDYARDHAFPRSRTDQAAAQEAQRLHDSAKLLPWVVCTSIWRRFSTTCSALVF